MKKTKRKKRGPASAEAAAKAPAKAPETDSILKSRVKRLEVLKGPYIIALCVVLFLGWWRLSSRPLRAILGTDRFTVVSAYVIQKTGAGDDFGVQTWQFYAEASEREADIAALTEILNSTRYRPDLGNLWLLRSDSQPRERGDTTVFLMTRDDEWRGGPMEFFTADTVEAAGKGFHPVDRTVLDRLAAYIREHADGTEKTDGSGILAEFAPSDGMDSPGSSDTAGSPRAEARP